MPVKRVPQAVRGVGRKKYLIMWSLLLDHGDLEKISRRPEALKKGLTYVKSVAKGSGLQIYRIVPMEEITRFGRPTPGNLHASANPTGIALAEGGSIEEVREAVNEWVEGLSYGGTNVGSHLEYEIKPLVELR